MICGKICGGIGGQQENGGCDGPQKKAGIAGNSIWLKKGKNMKTERFSKKPWGSGSKGYRSFMLATVFLVLLSGGSSLLAPILIQFWSRDQKGLTAERVAFLCGVLAAAAVLEILSVYIREKFAKKFNSGNCRELLGRFLHMQYDKINEMGPINITARIRQAVNDFYMYYAGGKITIYASGFIILGLLFVAVLYSWYFAVLLAVLAAINIGGYKALNKELLRRSEKLQKNTAEGWQEINTIVRETDYIKQLESYHWIFAQLEPSIDKIYDSMKEINIFAQTVSHGLLSFNNFVQTFIVLLVTFRFFQREEDIYSLIFYTVVMPLFFAHLNKLVNANLDKRNVSISKKFAEEIAGCQESDGKEELASVDTIAFQIKEADSAFLHLPEITELFSKGDRIWVKGKSGCGKSTLMKFLVKFRSTDEILINGQKIGQYSNRSVRKQIEYIPQNVPIVKGTLRDNLFLGRPYAPEMEQKMIESPILASVLQSKTMDSLITENGGNLSGGEKQKIAVARIMASQAEVLILDEITSNVDAGAAELILSTVLEGCGDKIVFIVSHDGSTGRFVNRCLTVGG